MPLLSAQLLKGQGYTNITVNNNPNLKDHIYGYKSWNVSSFGRLMIDLNKGP